jgi:hypothetical protein
MLTKLCRYTQENSLYGAIAEQKSNAQVRLRPWEKMITAARRSHESTILLRGIGTKSIE